MPSEDERNSSDIDALNSVDLESASVESGGESDTAATVGSPGGLDRAEEDFSANEKTRSTGFIGKNSEITWMQRLRQETKFGSPSPGLPEIPSHPLRNAVSSVPLPESEEGFAVSDSSYHLDDFAISSLSPVERYELPTRETANRLFTCYMARVHPSFPIIGKITFTAQFRRFMAGEGPGDKWLAILNLIFAISSHYSQLVQADWRGDHRDHLIYFTRARMLGMDGDTIFDHPDLQHIQVAGLISLYLLSTSQVNRSVHPDPARKLIY